MHSTLFIAAFGALFAAVTAVPVKRELIVNTITQVDVVTEMVTATVWVDAAETGVYHEVQYTQGAGSSPSSAAPVVTTTSVYVAPAPSTTSTSSTSTSTSIVQVVPQAYTAPAAPVASVPTTTSVYIAPVPTTTSVYIAPAPTTTSVYVAPAPTTTSVYVAPVPTTSSTSEYVAPTPAYTPPAAATTTTAAPAATTASSSSGQYSGDITYYDVGLGSCGYTNTDSEDVVAMAHGMMDKSTMCGKTVTLNYNGVSKQAKVVDTCMSCANGDLDLSPTLFKAIAPSGDGRVHGVSWSFT